jgi:DNA-directed RNA polymerase subunit RPC12/RpoP
MKEKDMTTNQSGITCPKCNSIDVMAKGTKGALGRTIATLFLGPLIGILIGKSTSDSEGSQSVQYKCKKCGNVFISQEKSLESNEQLMGTCKIILYRDKSFIGAIVPRFVYLNGKKIDVIKNGKSIEFTTNMKSNTITVTDHIGNAFKESYKFDTIKGGITEVHFRQKLHWTRIGLEFYSFTH